MYIKFLNSNQPIECDVIPNGNIVTLKFKNAVVVNTSGFKAYLDKRCEYDIGGDSYIGFTTMYRNDAETAKYNGYQLSNDGSVWTKPLAEVKFYAREGGTLVGNTTQMVSEYESLVIPSPVPNENYEFAYWSPAIPLSGDIAGNKAFYAIFESTIPIPIPDPDPEPEPMPTIEERLLKAESGIAELQTDVRSINTALGGGENE